MAAVLPQTPVEPTEGVGTASPYRKFAMILNGHGTMTTSVTVPTTFSTSDRALGNVKLIRRHFSAVGDSDTWASGMLTPATGPGTGNILKVAVKGDVGADDTARASFVASTGVVTFRTDGAAAFTLYIWMT